MELVEKNLYPLFSVPLMKTEIDVEIDLEYINNSIEYYRYQDFTGYGSVNQKILLENNFSDLRNKIEDKLKEYLFDILKFKQGNIVHVASWINLHKTGNYSGPHIHTNSMYSGIFYINVFEKCGNISFTCPQNYSTFSTSTITPQVSECNIYNSKSFTFKPRNRDLYIFPSHLYHSTGANHGTENRLSLAFNYFVEGHLGSDTSYINLKFN